MKNKIHKILGVSLTLVIALSLVAGFALPVAADETINEWYKFDYPAEGSAGDWFRQGSYDDGERIQEVRELTEAINGDLYVFVDFWGSDAVDNLLKSEDGGRTWEATGYNELDTDPSDTDIDEPGTVFDMVCSSIDEDILYVTDSYYVYKSVDGGDEFNFVARDSLEEQLEGACGCWVNQWRTITCIDVTYDDDDNPFLFIGTRGHWGECVNGGATIPGNVYWIGEAGYPATWTDLGLDCYAPGDGGDDAYDVFAIGCAPNWADSHETYVVVSDNNDTHVVSTIGVYCSWTEFAELLEDCVDSFDIFAASRIAFPDDWEDTETLFVGVTDLGDTGGDVYMATEDGCIDMNVKGISAGCVGIEEANIISLDIMGDMDEAQLIAGSFNETGDIGTGTSVYCSEDGGWEWDISAKDPTGTRWAYVIWYEDTALAATSGYECAVSMCCGEDYPCEFWNQISLIATDIDEVKYLGFSPGYVCEDSETMFMVTESERSRYYDENRSLFRHDGTYWERVYLGLYAQDPWGEDANWDDPDSHIDWVYVSPDFNETNTLYVASHKFGMWRSTDAGCSWDQLTFPCAPRPWISAAVVIDEDTVIAGGAWGPTSDQDGRGYVYKTTRHGARPWDDYEYDATYEGHVVSFALEPGYEDPGSVLLGDDESRVYISEDGGEEWDLVGDCEAVLDPEEYYEDTWVIFDPGYATNNTIYAACHETIARCIIDPDEDMADQEWEELCNDLYYAAGIAIADGTALYVTDADEVGYDNGDPIYNGGVLRSLNPDTDDADDVVFERIGPGLIDNGNGDTELERLWLTCDTSDEGCAENVLWSLDDNDEETVWVYEDTLAAPVVLDMPVEGQKLTTTDSATLSWNELCGADCYEVSLWSYCAECPDEKLAVDLCLDCVPGDTVACGPEIECKWDDYLEEWYCCPCTEEICIVVDHLEPGTTYYWQVRVCQGSPTLSKWSEERTFMTALETVDELCSPVCGGQDIILTTNFSWDAVDGATGYDIELATTETFTAGVVTGSSTVNAWVTEPLEYATTYYWRVRAEKDGVVSDWTVCIFTTIEAPVPAPPPVVVEPTPPAPVVPTPIIEFPPTPSWVWAIIGIGTALVVVVIVLTVRTRRPPA